MPHRTDQKVTDFVPGQRARVVKFSRNADLSKVGLSIGDIVTVEAVHPINPDYGSGTLTIQGKVNENADVAGGWHPGSFGHLLFEPLDEFEEIVSDDEKWVQAAVEKGRAFPEEVVETETRYPIGTRVIATDERTTVGNYPQGSGGSKYVGASGTITEHFVDGSYRIDFDDDDLSGYGSWTHDALDVLTVDREARIELAKAKVEIDNLTDALRRDRETWHGERSALTTAASDERRRLCDEIDTLKATLLNADQRIAALITEKTDAELQVESLYAALTYARSLLDDHAGSSLNGFEIGYDRAQQRDA